jgi:hypothetical protein
MRPSPFFYLVLAEGARLVSTGSQLRAFLVGSHIAAPPPFFNPENLQHG